MTTHTITARTTTEATPAQVWQLLAHTATWPTWAPVRAARLEQQGAPEADGVGAVRSFRTQMGTTTREQIVAFEARRHVGYVLRSGLPVTDYRSDVRLEPQDDGGTAITWTSTFDGSTFMAGMVRLTLRSFSRALARAASRVPVDA